MKSPRALILLSGGLDSLLAVKLLLEQGVKVTGLIFKSYFWDVKQAKEAAKKLEIEYKIINFAEKHLKIVKNPSYGYGKATNPCIDCHILMLKEAKKIMEAQNYDFVATGEVLGERPFSQNKKALEIIAKDSGLNDLLVRPLSARLLPPTLPEKKGCLKREALLAIQGRSRKTQIALAKKYQLSFPQPAGGCILTEKEFAKKLFDLFSHWLDCTGNDVALLFLGRHFWVQKSEAAGGTPCKDMSGVSEKRAKEPHREWPPGLSRCEGIGEQCKISYIKIVLGRNKQENEKLEKLAKKGDILIKPENFPGPTALIRGEKIDKKTLQKAKRFTLKFTKKKSTSPQFTTICVS